MEKFADSVILVVDDDEMNLNIARMILEKKLSCRVITASSGAKALEILGSQFVSLILLDVMMPEMGGIETLEKIRAKENLEDIPVIMLTATVDKDVIKQSIHLGVTEYLKKPFLPKELLERVSKKLEENERHLETVLVIDEDEYKLQRVQEVLEENFIYKIITATSIDDGIKILVEKKISLVIASTAINFVEGFKLLNFMANTETLESVPLVFGTPENILELVEKIKNPQPEKSAEVEKDSAIIRTEKKKTAHVVTNIIGYKLDRKI